MPVTTRNLSVNAAGAPLNGSNSETASISADGTETAYANLSGGGEVFLFDTTTGTNTNVGALAGVADVFMPDMSADGSHLVYSGFKGGATALFRQDLATNTTQTISASAEIGVISDDGDVVAYKPKVGGVFVAAFVRFDAAGNQTKGQFASNGVDAAAVDGISGDGEFVAFDTAATGGAQFGTASGGNDEIYLGDTVTGATPTLVSVNNKGQFAQNAGGNADSGDASVSESGTRIAFVSDATNLAFDAAGNPIPTNGNAEIYLRDTATNTTTLISTTATGAAPAGTGNDGPVISADGKYVLFDSTGGLLPGAGMNSEVYVYNVETGTTTLVSQTAAGAPDAFAFADNGGQSFSADDTETTFEVQPAGVAHSIVALATTTTTGGTPTIALKPVAGDGFVNAAEAGAGAAVTGTTTNGVGDTVKLYLDGRNATTGTAVGTGTVMADGTFSVGLSAATLSALAQGGHTLLATVQGDPTTSYLSGDASAAFTVDTTAPTASSPGLVVAQNAAATPIGIAAPTDNLTAPASLAIAVSSLPGDGTVTLADGVTRVAVGQALTAAQLTGLEFTPTAGLASQSSTFTYSVTDQAGNATTGTATLSIGPAAPGGGPTPPPPPRAAPDAVSFDDQVSFSRGTFALTGHVSSAAGVGSVVISAVMDGTQTTLGSAAVNADGTFDFSDFVGASQQGFITATETDGKGVVTSNQANFALQAGLRGPFRAVQTVYTPDGGAEASVSHFRGDGTRVVAVETPGQTLHASFFDTFRNGGTPDTTFVFDPGHGLDVVGQFRVSGGDHDTVSLLGSDFGNSVATVLQNTTNTAGGAVILDPTSGDTVKLAGVTKAQLVHNQGDFAFHA